MYLGAKMEDEKEKEAQIVVKEEEEGDNKVKLGLGIGVVCYGDQNPNGIEEVDVGKKKKKMCGDGGGGGGFTAAQLHELEQQLVIYKHLAAGLPVPFQLLLPIWNSVAASFGSSNAAALFKHYPSFVGFHPLGFDYRNQMDPEPGRCRRTDGKKWRCSKNVVSGQKYCEQHMHRGRQRSRKPVENSEVAPPSTTKAPKNSEGELSNSKTNLQISTPKSLQLLAQSSNNSSVSHGKTTASSAYHECKKNIESVTTTSIGNVPANGTATTPSAVATTPNASSGIHEFKKNIGSIPTTSIAHVPANRTATPTASTAFHECKKNIGSIPTTSITNVPANRTATTTSSSGFHECNKNKGSIPTTSIANVPANRTANTPAAVATTITGGPNTATNSSSNENNLNIGVKDNSSNHAGDNCMSRGSSNNRNNINVGSNISTGLGFSPKSVLQGGRIILLGRNGVCFDNRNGGELEPGRCRRTDGKKWRCRRDVLPDQKYCGRHIHRGAKRKLKEFQTVGVPSTSAAAMTSAQLSHTASVPTKTDCAIPNTNLSMSIPASMPLLQHDEKSNSSSDSDTTITDTSLAAYDDSYLSS